MMNENDAPGSREVPAVARAFGTLALAAATVVLIKWFITRERKDESDDAELQRRLAPKADDELCKIAGLDAPETVSDQGPALLEVSDGVELAVSCGSTQDSDMLTVHLMFNKLQTQESSLDTSCISYRNNLYVQEKGGEKEKQTARSSSPVTREITDIATQDRNKGNTVSSPCDSDPLTTAHTRISAPHATYQVTNKYRINDHDLLCDGDCYTHKESDHPSCVQAESSREPDTCRAKPSNRDQQICDVNTRSQESEVTNMTNVDGNSEYSPQRRRAGTRMQEGDKKELAEPQCDLKLIMESDKCNTESNYPDSMRSPTSDTEENVTKSLLSTSGADDILIMTCETFYTHFCAGDSKQPGNAEKASKCSKVNVVSSQQNRITHLDHRNVSKVNSWAESYSLTTNAGQEGIMRNTDLEIKDNSLHYALKTNVCDTNQDTLKHETQYTQETNLPDQIHLPKDQSYIVQEHHIIMLEGGENKSLMAFNSNQSAGSESEVNDTNNECDTIAACSAVQDLFSDTSLPFGKPKSKDTISNCDNTYLTLPLYLDQDNYEYLHPRSKMVWNLSREQYAVGKFVSAKSLHLRSEHYTETHENGSGSLQNGKHERYTDKQEKEQLQGVTSDGSHVFNCKDSDKSTNAHKHTFQYLSVERGSRNSVLDVGASEQKSIAGNISSEEKNNCEVYTDNETLKMNLRSSYTRMDTFTPRHDAHTECASRLVYSNVGSKAKTDNCQHHINETQAESARESCEVPMNDINQRSHGVAIADSTDEGGSCKALGQSLFATSSFLINNSIIPWNELTNGGASKYSPDKVLVKTTNQQPHLMMNSEGTSSGKCTNSSEITFEETLIINELYVPSTDIDSVQLNEEDDTRRPLCSTREWITGNKNLGSDTEMTSIRTSRKYGLYKSTVYKLEQQTTGFIQPQMYTPSMFTNPLCSHITELMKDSNVKKKQEKDVPTAHNLENDKSETIRQKHIPESDRKEVHRNDNSNPGEQHERSEQPECDGQLNPLCVQTSNKDLQKTASEMPEIPGKTLMSIRGGNPELGSVQQKLGSIHEMKIPATSKSCENLNSKVSKQRATLTNRAQSMLCLLSKYYSSTRSCSEKGPIEEISRGSFIRVPDDLQHLSRARRFQLTLGNCVELLKLAKNNTIPELLKAVYTVISDNYLNVLNNSAIYSQLSGSERDRVLQLRNRGKLSICVIEMESIFGRNKSNQTIAEIDHIQPKAQLYTLDMEQNQWRIMTSIPEEACLKGCSICSMHNYLFIAGGIRKTDEGSRCSNKLFCYNPLTDIWSRLTPMNQARSQLKLVPLDGYLYAIGGECLNTMERYDPRSNKWTFKAPLPKGSFAVAHEATACGGEMYISGGHLFYRLLKYSPVHNQWEECPFNASKDRSCDMVALGNILYRFDIQRDSNVSIFKYNTAAKIWSESSADYPGSKSPFRCVVLDGTIYCLNRETITRYTDHGGNSAFQPAGFPSFPCRGFGFPCAVVLSLPGSLAQTPV